MPTRKYIILLSGLFLALFFLPFSAKAQEENYAELLSVSVTIAGANVLCVGEETTVLTAVVLFPFDSLEWRTGATILGHALYGEPQYIQVTATHNQVFSVYIYDISGNLLGSADRQIFITTRPIVTEANRVNDTLCEGDNREVIVGMQNVAGAQYFLWTFDPVVNPNLVGDAINNWPGTGDSKNMHLWYQVTPNRAFRTVLTVQMSTYPVWLDGWENRCYTIDSAIVEIYYSDFQLVASEESACMGETITLTLLGDVVDNTIVWSTGQTNVREITATIVEVGDTIFRVEGLDASGCQGRGYVTIFGMPSPLNVRILVEGDSTVVCEGLSTRLTVECDDCASYWWITGETTQFIYTWPSGRFTHSVTVFGGPDHTMCSATASLEIIGMNCEAIYFPTAMRLSSQIGNNVWHPIVDPQEGTQYWFAIFNSWGQLIFESHDMSVGWDGKHNGQFVRPGTYVFLFRLTHIHRTWERTGTITVID